MTPTPQGAPPPKAAGSGRRPKHVPQRMCVACREREAKRALIRVVRTPQGSVEIDPTGKRNGRGAYLCDRATCWDRALSTNALARALNTTIEPETLECLRRHGAALATSVDVVELPMTNEVTKG